MYSSDHDSIEMHSVSPRQYLALACRYRCRWFYLCGRFLCHVELIFHHRAPEIKIQAFSESIIEMMKYDKKHNTLYETNRIDSHLCP